MEDKKQNKILSQFQNLSDEMSIDLDTKERIKSEVFDNQLQLKNNLNFFQHFMNILKSKKMVATGSMFLAVIFFSLPFIVGSQTSNVEMQAPIKGTYREEVNTEIPLGSIGDNTTGETENDQQKRPIAKSPTKNYLAIDEDTETKDRAQIRSGEFSIIVKDVNTKHKEFTDKVYLVDGYLLDSKINNDNYQNNATYTVRIPVDKFDEFTQFLREFGVEIESEDISLTDKQSELSQLTLSVEEKNTRITELNNKSELSVEEANELTKLEEEVLRITQNKETLEQETQYSTIEVELKTKADKVDSQIERAFADVKDAIIQVIVFWIWLIVPIFFLTPFVIVGIIVRKKRKN